MNAETDIRRTTAGRRRQARAQGVYGLRRGTKISPVQSRRIVQVLRVCEAEFSQAEALNATEFQVYGTRSSSHYLFIFDDPGTVGRQPEGRSRGNGLCLAAGTEGTGDAGSRAQGRRAQPHRTSATRGSSDRGDVRLAYGSTVPGQVVAAEEARQAFDGLSSDSLAAVEAARSHPRRDGHHGDHG